MYDYDSQIKRLTENPSKILGEWAEAVGLFKNVGNAHFCGCLTTIRDNEAGLNQAYIQGKYNDAITDAIRTDERLPKAPADITPAHLPVFKEWQEKIDAMNAE